MKGKDFDWQTNEFMLYCRTTQLREKSMMAYEQMLVSNHWTAAGDPSGGLSLRNSVCKRKTPFLFCLIPILSRFSGLCIVSVD